MEQIVESDKISLFSGRLFLLKWKFDSWTSMIQDPFPHPDKLGHFIAHFILTSIFFLFIGDWRGILFDVWINTQVEVMDGSRPRKHLYWGGFVIYFQSQTQYEERTIEGFSLKDWISGLLGAVLAWYLMKGILYGF